MGNTIFKSTELGFPQLGKTFFGQWWKKFNDSHLSETKLKLVLIRQDKPVKQETSEAQSLLALWKKENYNLKTRKYLNKY